MKNFITIMAVEPMTYSDLKEVHINVNAISYLVKRNTNDSRLHKSLGLDTPPDITEIGLNTNIDLGKTSGNVVLVKLPTKELLNIIRVARENSLSE